VSEVLTIVVPDTKNSPPRRRQREAESRHNLGGRGRRHQRRSAHVRPPVCGRTAGKDFLESLNPNSLKVVTAIVELSLTNAAPDQKFQFERQGCFVADRVDHVTGSKPVFNLAVGLKDG
jgi:glutaminyl-tRNA synthetase